MKHLFVQRHAAALTAVLCLAASAITGCASTANWSMPTASRLVELGAVGEDANLESLNRGRVIAIRDCRDCHRTYWPQEYHHKRWPTLSEEMGRLAGMTRKQINDLTAYMVVASQIEELRE